MKKLIDQIIRLSSSFKGLKLMEVCGTHTVSIYKYGIISLLPSNIELISGPGCPVCVTETVFIDKAIEYLNRGYKILTFGDMVRVPGNKSSLEKQGSENVRVVYSPLDALDYAREHRQEKVIFLAVGFETTAPLIAAVVEEAKKNDLSNFFILSSLRLIPPALKYLLDSKEVDINGLLLPGHVATVTGIEDFKKIADKYGVVSVVSGFDAQDIMESIVFSLDMLHKNGEKLRIQYKKVVREEGNILAQGMMCNIFDIIDLNWRGLGKIEKSGLKLKPEYEIFDIESREPLKIDIAKENTGCRCSEIIKGLIKPRECALFDTKCNPQNPQGPCMVSSEGSCAAYYKYGRE
ncbi:MAG: hydrogenase formation protein HypD [Candidatus Saelkia tenebricola]|nr:hydrogenase formation protein HypD [Candidatus Saelkia tenebricola]